MSIAILHTRTMAVGRSGGDRPWTENVTMEAASPTFPMGPIQLDHHLASDGSCVDNGVEKACPVEMGFQVTRS